MTIFEAVVGEPWRRRAEELKVFADNLAGMPALFLEVAEGQRLCREAGRAKFEQQVEEAREARSRR